MEQRLLRMAGEHCEKCVNLNLNITKSDKEEKGRERQIYVCVRKRRDRVFFKDRYAMNVTLPLIVLFLFLILELYDVGFK